MERRNQYFRFAFVFAWNIFPAAAYERKQVVGFNSGRSCGSRDDTDCRCAGRSEARFRVSVSDFYRESVRHAAVDRTYRLRSPQILSGADGIESPVAVEVRCHPGIEITVRQTFCAGAKNHSASGESRG